MSDSPLPPDSSEKPENHAADQVPAETITEPKSESRMRRFTRALLRWLVIVLVLFAAGVAVIYFTRVQPLEAQQKQAIATETALKKENTGLQQLRSDNAILTSANKDLNAMLAQDKAHMELLRALNNVNSARMFLALEDLANSKKALGPVKDELTAIGTFANDQATVKPILDRLNLVLIEIDGNAQTAASDLGIMNDQLVQLEKQLFPES